MVQFRAWQQQALQLFIDLEYINYYMVQISKLYKEHSKLLRTSVLLSPHSHPAPVGSQLFLFNVLFLLQSSFCKKKYMYICISVLCVCLIYSQKVANCILLVMHLFFFLLSLNNISWILIHINTWGSSLFFFIDAGISLCGCTIVYSVSLLVQFRLFSVFCCYK